MKLLTWAPHYQWWSTNQLILKKWFSCESEVPFKCKWHCNGPWIELKCDSIEFYLNSNLTEKKMGCKLVQNVLKIFS